MTDVENITIRRAGDGDEMALRRLSELDSKHLPRDDFMVAELAGEPVAALGLRSGTLVADPFRPTAEVADLLRLRVAGAKRADPGSRPARHPLRRLVAT